MCVERLESWSQGNEEMVVRTVLLVEDEPLIRMTLAEDLRGFGFAVIEARSADEARGLLLEHPEIDSVVTDVRMPGDLDGLDLARLVATERPEVRLVIMSGNWPTGRAPPAAATVLSKPFEIGLLGRLLASAEEGTL